MQKSTNTLTDVQVANVVRCAHFEVNRNPNKRSRMEAALVQTWGSGQHEPWDDEAGMCRICRASIDSQLTAIGEGEFSLTMRGTICDQCNELVRAHYYATGKPSEITLTPSFDEQCPEKTRELIETGATPYNIDAQAMARVKSWRPNGAKGLAICGPAGSGKTLAAWSLFRELEREGCSPKMLTAIQLGRILSEAARDIHDVSWLYNCRVLMIDDLGKEKLTPSMAALFWEVLDKRYGMGRPIILTTRFNGQELQARFGEQYLGEDIRRRLNELCVAVRFETQKAA